MNRMTKSITALAVVLAFTASACSGGSGGSDSANTPASKPVAKETNDVNETPRADVEQGGTLKWAISDLPANYNPQELDGALQENYYIINAMLPSAFTVDAKGDLTPDKNYVESAEITSTSPKQVITYKLNPKAVWEDGTPVSVADYQGMWKALNAKTEAYQPASTTGYENIESVEAGADQFEVVVTFETPYADWKGLFSQMIPASTSNDPKAFNEGWLDKPLASAGPFKLDKVDQTAKSVTLVPNDKWWGDAPKLDSIIFRAIDTDAQVDAIANSEVDVMDIGPDIDAYNRASDITGVEIRRAAGPNFRHITINGTGPILKDLQVRRAVALAIDRQTIAKALLGPFGGSPTALQNHIFMQNQTGYQDNAGEFSKVNVEKANSVLEAAGWKKGSGEFRTKDGKTLEINIVIPSQVTTSKQESELMQGMLAKAGIKLTINTVASDDFFDKYISTGDFDLTVFSFLGTPFPVSSSASIYEEPTGSGADLNIQQNFARIGNSTIDDLFAQANKEFDPKKTIDLGNQIDREVWKEVHSLTTYQRPDLWAARTTVANMGAYGFATLHYEDMGFTK